MKDNLTVSERKRWARFLYVKKATPISEVAHELNTDEATIRRWITEGQWDTVRKSLSISKSVQLEYLYQIAEGLTMKLAGNDPNPKELDQLMKYSAIIKNLDTENSVYGIIEAAEVFTEWLYKRNKPLAQTFVKEFDKFVKERKAA